MARMEFADIENSSQEVKDAFARLPAKLNIFRMMAHAQTCLVPAMRLGGAILGKQRLSSRLREMVILAAARIEGGEYEWVQHVPIGLACGITQPQIDALDAQDFQAGCFDATDKAVLRFTQEVVRDVRASEEAFAAVAAVLSPQEIVEVILTAGFYMMMARLTESTGVEIDAGDGMKLVEGINKAVKRA